MKEFFFHLSFLKKVQQMCGLSEETNHSNMILNSIYKIYCLTNKPFYILNLLLVVVEMTMKMDDHQIVGESLSYFALYIIMFVSLLYIQSTYIQKLFQEIDEMEETLSTTSHNSIIEIYGKYSKINIVAGQQIFGVCGTFCFCFAIHHLKILEGKRSFIYYQWYPVDTNRYYWVIAINQFFFLSVAFFYLMYTKLSVIAFSTYILGRIKVLQHILVGMDDYAKSESVEDIHESRFNVIKKCVLLHNELIQ